MNLFRRQTEPISRLDDRKVRNGESSAKQEFSFSPVKFLINSNSQNKIFILLLTIIKLILIYYKGLGFWC